MIIRHLFSSLFPSEGRVILAPNLGRVTRVPAKSPRLRAFSLIEVLVSMAILSMLMAIIFTLTNEVSKAWKNTATKIEAFQGARAAFDTITRKLSQSTLNVYYDYYDSAGNSATESGYSGTPTKYGRKSELHFISGKALAPGQITHAIFFQAPLGLSQKSDFSGMDNLLNECGFYIEYDGEKVPAFLTGVLPQRPRYRLMEFVRPTEQMTVYQNSTNTKWFTDPLAAFVRPVHVLADNIVALIIVPLRAKEEPSATTLAPQYEYDSRTKWSGGGTQPATMHSLPPVVQVILVAIDETSALRSCTGDTAPFDFMADLFQKATNLESDLETLSNRLDGKDGSPWGRLNYRVFRANVPLASARWSDQS